MDDRQLALLPTPSARTLAYTFSSHSCLHLQLPLLPTPSAPTLVYTFPLDSGAAKSRWGRGHHLISFLPTAELHTLTKNECFIL